MDSKVALQILDNVSGLALLNRADHVKVQEAVKVLQEAIEKKEEKSIAKE